MLVKEITPLCKKLQQAFLVYEDQTDCDWERGFYVPSRGNSLKLRPFPRKQTP